MILSRPTVLSPGRMALAVVFSLLSPLCLADDAQKGEQAKKPDAGKFILTIQGAKAGTTSFKFDADGGSEADAAVDVMGQSMKFKVSVKARAGKMTGFGADAGTANHFTATLDGDKAKVSINDAAAETQSIPAGAVPFGNFSPHLMDYALAVYDAKKGGTQTLQLMLIEGLPGGQLVSFPGKLTAKGSKPVTIAGKPVAVTTYTLLLSAGGMDIEMKLYGDSDRHVLAWKVSSQDYTAVREGYEAVLKDASP